MMEDEIFINREIDKPVMFYGVPLNLFFLQVLCVLIAFLSFILIKGTQIYILYLVPFIIAIGSITVVKIFYRKYGIHGFKLTQRDKSMQEEIKMAKSYLDILNEKNNNVRFQRNTEQDETKIIESILDRISELRK